MFVIELTYKAALSEIDRHMKAHAAFLNQHYASGRFVVSGGLADFRVVEFRASQRAPDLPARIS